MMYQYGFYSPFHFLFTCVGWVIFFFVILWLFRAIKGKDHFMGHLGGGSHDKAMEMLREKYVKGEINKEEFEQKKKDLMV